MSFERAVKESFRKVKEDTEGMKNELAFALKRIAKLEDSLTKQVIIGSSKNYSKFPKKGKK